MQSFSACSMKQTALRLSKLAASGLDSIPNEATTISALVRPFIGALGYNTDDPNEFVAEFPSDFTSRGDCADCAVLCDRKPVMIIECKCCKSQLKHQHVSQLRKYFSVHPSARLGILTNGVEYQFFTDSQNPNIMDEDPFLSFSIHDPDSVPYKALGIFSKGSNIARALYRMKTITRIKNEITNEINEPYGELARIVFSGVDLSGESPSPVVLHEEVLSHVREALSGIVDPENISVNKVVSCWCSIRIFDYRNVVEVQFNERGKKWLLMNVIKFKKSIDALSDISLYYERIREAANDILQRHAIK